MEKDNDIKQVCKNFMYKNCQREDCKFIHDNTICFYYWKHGSCKFQSECKNSHDVVLQPMTFRQGNDKGNYKSNDKGNYKSNDKGNYKSNDKGNYKSNDKGNYKSDDKSDDKGNYKGNYKSNDKGNYKSNDKNYKSDDKNYKSDDKNYKSDDKNYKSDYERQKVNTNNYDKGDVKGNYERQKVNTNNYVKSNYETRNETRDVKGYDKDKGKRNKDKYNNKRKKNTECFVPKTDPVDLRVVLDLRSTCNYNEPIPELTSRDVLLSPKLFEDFGKYEIYNKLVSEIENCGIPETELLKLWHGNDKIEGTHFIADDHCKWKEHCPIFNMIIQRLKQVFKMDIKTTRFNWYRDPDHWKPFHKDSSAINPDRALTQNFTVAVSFGITKDAAFEHAKTKTVISMPQPDGTVYSFTNDTNGIWRHGILQDKREQELGRISIIAWGWIDNVRQILQ